ncbi:MAG: DUF1015 family protein [Spirochaetia bacterium]|nr:DUF1015 family protein [Spirochaetia bacterium]
MLKIRKFKAIRPAKEFAKKLASYPYDVVSTDEARELAKDNKYSFLHVVRSEVDLPENTNPYSGEVYQKAKENFQGFLKDGVLIQDETPRLYLYRQIMNQKAQYGIVACVSAEDYENNKIKKHELTRKEKENDRTNHVITTNINSGPVFLTYKPKSEIKEAVAKISKEEPEYDFTADDGIQHTVWIISNDDICVKLIDHFSKMDCLYIADGHHRAASAAAAARKRKSENSSHTSDEEYNFFLAVLFPADELTLLDYNRAVKDLNGLSKDEFIEKIKSVFDIETTTEKFKPQKKGQFGMYLENLWYKLTLKSSLSEETDPVKNLDTSKLQNYVFESILGIDDPRTNDRIDFIGGIRGLEELEKIVNKGSFAVSFALYPTSTDELMKIADAEGIMAPKSTWFEPKLRSGLLIHDLE